MASKKVNEEKVRAIRVQREMAKMDHKELIATMGLARQAMLKLKGVGVNSQDYFVCPITDEVLKKRSGKKVVTLDRMTRYHKETSWYYISRKAFNKIQKHLFFNNVKKLK